MNSSESSQPLRDPWRITSVMLNRFLSLSKNPFTPPYPIPFPLPILPILNGQYQAAWNANHRFWEDTSVKSYKIQLPVFLFLVLHQFLYQQILFLKLSRISFNIIWKNFLSQIFLFWWVHHSPSPTPPKSGKCDKVFCWFALKCLLKYFFFQKFTDKILKSIF